MNIHFYESLSCIPQDCTILYDWQSINNIWKLIIEDKKDNVETEIHTTQMCMLSTTWLLKGYRMFVHQDNGDVYEIVLRDKNNQGNNSVRIAQNVYAMWANNVFRI